MVVVFDLDDTLYNEIDFVRSGLKEVAQFLGKEEYFDFMWRLFEQEGSGKIFDSLVQTFKLDVSVQELVNIYRFHRPKITLPQEQKALLSSLATPLALISDGHYLMQQNKFFALGLEKFIPYSLFTHFYHTKKPEKKPFLMLMERFRDEKEFVYIADNPKKDFLAPKELGWLTIRYKNSEGIYRDVPNSAHYEIEEIGDVLHFLKLT